MVVVRKICESCDGNGWIVNEAVLNNPQLQESDGFTCQPCDGEGWIPVEEEDD